jgi:hypothetical protein
MPVNNLVPSLYADVRFFCSALRMGALPGGFLFLLGADWSGALVRPGFAGPWHLVLSHTTALGSWEVHSRHGGWGPVVQLARSVDVTTSHTTTMGSWEVHSDVGLVSAGEDALWGSGHSRWCTDARGGWYLCVVAVLRFPLLDRPWAYFAGQHTNPWDSPLTVICDSKFPLLVHARAGGGLPKQQPKTKTIVMRLIWLAALSR